MLVFCAGINTRAHALSTPARADSTERQSPESG